LKRYEPKSGQGVVDAESRQQAFASHCQRLNDRKATELSTRLTEELDDQFGDRNSVATLRMRIVSSPLSPSDQLRHPERQYFINVRQPTRDQLEALFVEGQRLSIYNAECVDFAAKDVPPGTIPPTPSPHRLSLLTSRAAFVRLEHTVSSEAQLPSLARRLFDVAAVAQEAPELENIEVDVCGKRELVLWRLSELTQPRRGSGRRRTKN
jgi:hypothetical protein